MSSKAVRAGAAFVELFADDSKLVRSLNAASKRIKKWAADAKKTVQAFGRKAFDFGKWTFGVGAAVGGSLLAATQSFMNEGDKFEKMAYRTGMATEALSELGYAASQCGTSIETIEGSVRKMHTLMAEAGKGSDSANQKLAALGLRYKNLKNLSPEEQFMTLVGQLQNVKDDGRRAALRMEVFGKSATELLPLIDAGADAIAEMRSEARQLGVSMSGADAAAAAEFSSALGRLYALFGGITNYIGSALAPELTKLVNWFVKGVSPVVEWIDKNRELIVTIAKWSAIVAGVGAGLMAVGVAVIGLGAVIGALGTITVAVFGIIKLAIVGIGATLGFLLTPIGAVVAAVAGFGAYFLYTSGLVGDAIEGMKTAFLSLFSTATKAWQGISDSLAAGRLDLVFKVAWTAIKLVWTQGVNFLHEKWLWLSGTLQEVWHATVYWISNALVRAWAEVQTTWTETVYAMQSVWAEFSKGVVDAWKTAERSIAKGIGLIIAKMQGLDPTEMSRILDENYDHEQKKRDRSHTSYLGKIETDRKTKLGNIEAEKSGTLDVLKDDYVRKQDARQSAYQKQLEDMDKARLEAEREFNDAVKEAAAARAQTEAESKMEQVVKRSQKTAIELGAEIKRSSSGTFNAAAIQSLQAQGPMDRIAKSTEETAKNTKRILEKDNAARAT